MYVDLKPSPSIPLHALDALQDDALLPICVACGTQYPRSHQAVRSSSETRGKSPNASGAGTRDVPECPVCLDPRQYVPASGQQWTTLAELSKDQASGEEKGKGQERKHRLLVDERDESISMIVTEPGFGINQTPILIETADGSYVWDCAAFLSLPLIGHLTSLKRPLKGIAISHPHFFSTSLTWSRALNVPLYLNEDDKEWYQRLGDIRESDPVIWWIGERELGRGVKVIQCGGHFPGSSVLYWDRLTEPAPPKDDLPTKPTPVSGILFTADTLMVQPTQRGFSFLWSVPNMIPLRPKAILRIYTTLKHLSFDEATSSWPNKWIRPSSSSSSSDSEANDDAKKALEESVILYLAAEGWRLDENGELVELVS
ncbi:hydrolase [Kwoniella heveanensis CBS 569]|nr:hydrolase [Kwoniella heveanensis CBS 569]